MISNQHIDVYARKHSIRITQLESTTWTRVIGPSHIGVMVVLKPDDTIGLFDNSFWNLFSENSKNNFKMFSENSLWELFSENCFVGEPNMLFKFFFVFRKLFLNTTHGS